MPNPGVEITGTDENDTLEGGTGNDKIEGLHQHDVLYGYAGSDTLYGGGGWDTLYGGVGSDHLYGNGGSDVLDGGLGADVMHGGGGDDTYYIDDVDDLALDVADGGYDRVYLTVQYDLTKLANIERVEISNQAGAMDLVGTDGDDAIWGNNFNNYLSGGNGDDMLASGGGGFDVLDGGAGNDELRARFAEYAEVYGGAGDDKIIGYWIEKGFMFDGGAGNDTINVERADEGIIYGGLGDDLIRVDSDSDDVTVYGGAGNDRIYAGNWLMDNFVAHGGSGNDSYFMEGIDSGTVVEQRGGGYDTLEIWNTAAFRVTGEVEEITFHSRYGTLFAGDYDNYITAMGNGGDGVEIYAGDGNDTVRMWVNGFASGGEGNDVLIATEEGVEIHGGAGNDILNSVQSSGTVMVGDSGNDTFILGTRAIDDGALAATIGDFNDWQDTIELRNFDGLGDHGVLGKEYFHTGSGAHDASDRVVYDRDSGMLYYDADGNGAGAQVLIANITVTHGALSADDFIVA